MRYLLPALLALALAGCELVHKLPTRQGNVIEQKQLDKLQPGMTQEQVRFLLGTPIADSPFRADRWDYTGYYRNPRGKVFQRTVTLYFDDGALVRMEGIEQARATDAEEFPEIDPGSTKERRKTTTEEREIEDRDTGIVITPGAPD
jgi:outer membrane protein assembly factor BamE